MHDETDGISVKALAIALVAVSKSLSAACPDYGVLLSQTLQSAEAAGLDPAELNFLRTLVTAAQANSAARKNRLV